MFSRTAGWWGRCARLVAVVLALGVGVAARGQVGFGGGGGSPITKRSLGFYAKVLKFDDAQHEAARALLDGYTTEVGKVWSEFSKKQQAAMREAQEEGDWKTMGKSMAEAGEVAGQRQKELEKTFFDDLKSLCTPEQAVGWDRVERARRREQFTQIGLVSGAGVDLVRVLDATKTAPKDAPEFDAAVERYELDMDQRLGEVRRSFEDMESKQKEMNQNFDMSKLAETMEKVKEMMSSAAVSAKAVRDLNREYTRKLSEMMGEADRAKFLKDVNLRSFPRVYREPHVVKMLAAAADMSDLSAEQRAQIKEVRESYERDAAPLNEAWVKAIQDQEEQNGGTLGIMATSWMGEQPGAAEVKAARKARRDLDDAAAERLKAVLNDAQRSRLPEKVEEPFNPMGDFQFVEQDTPE